jgi:hypothetical protein
VRLEDVNEEVMMNEVAGKGEVSCGERLRVLVLWMMHHFSNFPRVRM